MKYLLGEHNVGVLAKYAQSTSLLAFDFDGTLAPIASDRFTARMRPKTRLLLSELGRLYPCVVISGRSRADTLQKTRASNVTRVVGNHGLELGNTTRSEKRMKKVYQHLRHELRDVDGIDLENKRLSLAVHYRSARSKRAARSAIRAALNRLTVPIRIIPGKLLVNIVPQGAPGKGHALIELRKSLRVQKALYVGDDVTDEDVFKLRTKGLLGIRIGRSKTSSAAYFLRDQKEIDRLLLKLISLRTSG